MVFRVSSLLFAPRRFFERERADLGVLGPFLVLIATGSITLGGQLLLVSMSVIGDSSTLAYVTSILRVELPAITVAGALVSFGHVFVYWVGYAAIFHGGTWPFSNDGQFRDVFLLTGWGFLPWFLTGLVWLVAMIGSAQITPAPTTPAESDIFVRQVQETTLVRGARMVDSVGMVWSLWLWGSMLRAVRDVTWPQAALAVLPVAVFEFAKLVLL
ncbi:putative conserved membrane protein, Yip1family [Halanaeroarchaeum sp. HSR-CO]|uniref:YIP1 family protein n=1 Tax=Halanaeroarchaeum sp. HSR-CO TaxID=2866382 RepID=UPI00217CF5C8|nr:YIP1 family protein [Halanaeroarchaeum sp. HSR-CO]UWG46766.1 putative conserved membrane protein, Yip1family [Halanaeroarchaeum sp. HSR-CO]